MKGSGLMKKKMQMIRNFIIFILLIILTFILIFRNYDYKITMDIMLKADFKFIILATIVMFLNISFESLNVKNILNTLGKKVPLLRMIKYTLIGFFFSGITPAAGGGQPMEVYYMKRDRIPVTSSTIALLLETISFHIVTIICGLIGLALNYKLTTNGFIYIFIVGLTLKMILLAIMLICLFSKKLSDTLVKWFINILKKFKYQKIDELTNEVTKALNDYHESAKFIKKHQGIFIKSTLTVFIQVLFYYSVTYFIYRSFGLNDHSYLTIISLQALLFVSVASIPLPGAVGISESAFLKLYITIFGLTNLASATILTRCVNFYLFMIIGFVVVLIHILYLNKKKQKVTN